MKRLASAIVLIAFAARAQTPPRALPVEDNVPRAIPVKPATPDTAPPRPQVVEDDAKAKGPDDDLFEFATLAFTQKDYTIAAQNFGKYLQTFPAGKHVADALYRLAECNRNLQRMDDAARYYREIVDKHAKSSVSANAAYWLGVISYNGGDFKAGATFFGFCESHADNAKVKNAAAFYKSECYGMLKDRKKQLAALQPVLEDTKDNEYHEKALLSAATVYQLTNDNAKALPLLLELIDSSEDPAVQGNAALKAAIIQSDAKKSEESTALYKRVLDLKLAPAELRGAALVGYVGELYAKQDYEGVIDIYNRNASLLPPTDLRPRLLMHVANAQRMKKNFAGAISLYDMLQQYFAEHELAFEAGYWKVYCLYLQDDKRLPDEAAAFVQKQAGAHKDHEFINSARLLIADNYFTRQDYKLATTAFQAINVTKLPERFQASTLFHQGWSEAEAGLQGQAIATLTSFISRYSNDPDLPKALAKRGLCNKETQNIAAALEDFTRITKEFPKHDAAELALYLSGMIHVDKRDWKSAVTAFETLLQQFPKSGGVPDAHYKAGLAYVEMRDTDKALPHFRKAVELDEKSYGNAGTQKVLLCLWNKKDADALSKEVDAYRAKYQNASLVPSMLGYLGLTFFDRKDFARSAKYLTWASTPDAPENTDPRIWNYLGQALLESKSYNESIQATDHYLAAASEGMGKANGLLTKANALLGLEKPDEALTVADEALHIVKAGRLQGQLMLTQGDALLAMGDKLETDGNHDGAKEKWGAAASKYIVPSQVLNDDFVTPLALSKAAAALERSGDKAKAQEMRDQLKKDFPAFKEP